MQNRKKKLWMVILLILLFSIMALFWKRKSYSKEIPPNFLLQDSTTIAPGEFEIKIWDYSVVDGDTVNVFFDGKKIFKKLLITNTPAIYQPGFVKPGRHWLGIKALSEGTIGAATTHVSLSNGKNNFEFDIEAHKNQPAYRLIIVQ